MKKILLSVAMLCMALGGRAETQDVCQGWPEDYGGVMLQGFWWDSFEATKWSTLTARADELSQYFDLIWIPNSGTCSGDPNATTQPKSNGYDPCYWLTHNSIYGTEEELRTMINTYKAKNVGIIEDVVINHKKGVTNWCDFAQETVTGQNTNKEYSIAWDNDSYSQICQSDECNSNGYHTTGANDTGDDFDGYRDLDHTNATTRANVKVYLDFLLHELGYAGFRYDMVKGYGAGYIQEYNNDAMPTYSVGEFWDNQTNIQNWIMGTGNTSAAFDFPLKFKMNEAISNGDYSAFEFKSFTFDKTYSKLSVTFADNHDTGRESSKLANNWSAANAFILASPGTPCVWYPHYNADPTNIRAMILARKACGITNTDWEILKQYPTENNSGYILETKGTKGSVYVQLGAAADDGTPDGYTLVAEGDAYKFYSSVANFASVKVSPDGGAFTDETVQVTLTPVNATQGAWYTIGSEASDQIPLTQETTITIGADYDVNEDITLFWGAKGDDGVEYTGSTTFTKREYYTPAVESADEVSVFFETEAKEVFIWAWDDNDVNYTGGDWDKKPAMDLMGVNDAGKLIYKWTYVPTRKAADGPTKVIFVYGDTQTEDLPFVSHGYYDESGLLYELGENTLYFDNTASNWTNVYYYAWGANGSKAEWPGELMETLNDDGYYEVTLDKAYTSIIFNDGIGGLKGFTQTEDLTAEDGKVYALATNTVYFDNTESNWDEVYCYAYNEDDPDNVIKNADWPGVKIEPNGDGLYEASLLEGYKLVIFNCGQGGDVGVVQTADLEVVDGKIYTLSGGANTQDGYTVYFDNSVSKWTDVYYYTWGSGGNKASWPGEKITETNEQGYYVVHVDGTAYNKIIFNAGKDGPQTADFDVVDGRVYTSAGVTTALVLSDDEPFFNGETFTASSVTYTREMSYRWGTILMPFELTSDDEVQYYELTAVDEDVMTLEKVESVPAGEPAVFKLVNGPGTLEISATNVDVVPTADENKYGTGVASWYMNGTYQGKSSLVSKASKNIYFIAQDKFWLAEAAITVKPFRAWFETNSSLSAAKMRIEVEGETEGIQKIEEERNAQEIVYDLMGRQSDSSRKGIVIKNGTIIFVK